MTNIAEELEIGQAVSAKILEIDTERKRISLSIKQTLEGEDDVYEAEPETEEEADVEEATEE